jgi:hypothetical protein
MMFKMLTIVELPFHHQMEDELYFVTPREFEDFGYTLIGEDGKPNLLEILGNVPGRQEAGRIWGDIYSVLGGRVWFDAINSRSQNVH